MSKTLIFVTPKYSNWAGATRGDIVVCVIEKEKRHNEIENFLENFVISNTTFLAVAFCPDHGHVKKPKIKFRRSLYELEYLVSLALKVTTNIHFCSCYSGRHLHPIACKYPQIVSLTGYKEAIGADDGVEDFQLLYITNGCKNRNTFIPPENHSIYGFIHYSFSKVSGKVKRSNLRKRLL
jgi:hypothetical protein